MRVAYLTTWFPGAQDTVAGSFIAREVALLAQDHDVEVTHLLLEGAGPTGREARTLALPGIPPVTVPVHRLGASPRRPGSLIRTRRRIRGALDQADLLHTGAFSTLLPLVGVRVNIPWVHTEHWSGLTDPALPRGLRLTLAATGRLLRRPDLVTAVSQYSVDGVRRWRPGPCRVVPCVVAPADPVLDRRSEPVPLRLVAVGGLVAGKNPLLAIETVAELRARGESAELTWVGGGPLLGAAQAHARDLGLEGAVTFTGPLPPEEVNRRLAAADLFLLPTRRETFCVAAAEAVAAGRPVVIGARGGQREVLPSRVAAFVDVMSDGAPARLADAVSALMARTAGWSAAEIAESLGDRFSPESVARDYRAAYAAACAAVGRPVRG